MTNNINLSFENHEAKLKEIGFNIYCTGGNCTAYKLDIENDFYVLITDETGSVYQLTEEVLIIALFSKKYDYELGCYSINYNQFNEYFKLLTDKAKQMYNVFKLQEEVLKELQEMKNVGIEVPESAFTYAKDISNLEEYVDSNISSSELADLIIDLC